MNTSPSHLLRIDDLTRRYARYSRHQAGLSAVWAGLCIALLGEVVLTNDLLRYAHRPAADHAMGFWRFLISAPSQPQQLWLLMTVIGLPALWFLGRTWIQRRVYEQNGTVIGQETPDESANRQLLTILEIACPCLLLPLSWIPLALQGFPAALLPGHLLFSAFAIAIPLVGRRLTSGLDRTASLLLFFGCGGVAAGGASESHLVSMLAYSILGLVLAGSGLRSHWEYRRVQRELEQLAPACPEPDTTAPSPDQPTGFLSR